MVLVTVKGFVEHLSTRSFSYPALNWDVIQYQDEPGNGTRIAPSLLDLLVLPVAG